LNRGVAVVSGFGRAAAQPREGYKEKKEKLAR
jgi:hypothetical protein